jgi:hypothetical protein
VCWPFKGKHPLKIFVVENIDSLQVSIYEYESNLFTIYSTRVTIEADITLVFLFHN